jgi:hypothetical protein
VGDKEENEKNKQTNSSNMTPSTTISKSKLEMENMIMSTPTLTTNNAVETTPSVLTSSPINLARTEVDDTNNLQTIGSPIPIEPTVVSIPITTPIHKNMPSSSSSSAVKSTLAEDVLVKKSSCFC